MEYTNEHGKKPQTPLALQNIFKKINIKSFFIDYLSVNWQMDITKFSQYDAKKAQTWFHDFYRVLEERIKILKLNNPELYNIFLQKDTHYNIKIDFKGKFFKDVTYTHDIKHFYKWFLEFDNMFSYYWTTCRIDHKYPRSTVSRLDLATHKEATFLKSFTPIRSKKGENLVTYQQHEKYNFLTGLSIGKRNSNWTYFRAYDKRFEKPGIQHCMDRFKTIDVVRKEWMLKSKFLRHNNISTVLSFIEFFNKKELVTSLIRKIRLAKDVVLFEDNALYRSLHDYRYDTSVDGGYLTPKEFNKIVKEETDIFLNKVSPGDENTTISKWNPNKNLQGIVKYLNNMTRNEFFAFQKKMLQHIEKERFDSCDLTSLNENSKFIDWDQRDFETVTNMLQIMRSVKIKKVITA